MEYFSDKERGPAPRNVNDIPHNVWQAIVELINSLSNRVFLEKTSLIFVRMD